MGIGTIYLDTLILCADLSLFASFLAVFKKATQDQTASGISLQTLGCVVTARCSHLLSHYLNLHFRPNSIPFSIYALMDVLNAAMGVFVLYTIVSKYLHTYESKKDNFGRGFLARIGVPENSRIAQFGFMYLLTVILAFGWYLVRRSHASFWVSYFCCFYEVLCAVALLPQLWMFQQDRVVSPLLANFVAMTAINRCCTLLFWLSYPWVHVYRYPDNRGVQMASEILNILILSDFLYYVIKAKLAGQRQVVLPMYDV